MYICCINTTICLQYFSVLLHSNQFVYFRYISFVTEKKRPKYNMTVGFNLKILTLCKYRQVIYHRKGKILFFSNVYKLFRFVQYSSKYQELNMVKLLKTMNAWRFFWVFLCLLPVMLGDNKWLND